MISGQAFYQSDREGIQTPNLLIRSQTLYSVELRSQFLILSKSSRANQPVQMGYYPILSAQR